MKKIVTFYFNGANFVTLSAIQCSFLCLYFFINDQHVIAMLLFIVAGFLDSIDGAVARKFNRNRSRSEKHFGQSLDGIADALNFGAIPIVIGLFQGLTTLLDLFILSFYGSCIVIRLAYFDSLKNGESPQGFFIGLPSTSVSYLLPSIFGIGLFFNATIQLFILRFFFVGLSLLFVLNIKVIDIRQHPRYFYGFCLCVYVGLPLFLISLIV